MSEEKVEIVEQLIAAYSGTSEAHDDLIDPRCRVSESPELPGVGRVGIFPGDQIGTNAGWRGSPDAR